jgi:hypothetical protein
MLQEGKYEEEEEKVGKVGDAGDTYTCGRLPSRLRKRGDFS